MSHPHVRVLITVLAIATGLLSCSAELGPAWTQAAPFEGETVAETSVSQVEIDMNESGDAIAVWSGRTGGERNNRDYAVWTARFTARSGWSAVTRLGSADGRRGADGPVIAIGDDGRAVAAWREWALTGHEDEGGEGIWVARFDPATQWEPATLLGEEAYSASVAANGQGQAAVTWNSISDGIWVSRLQSDSQWSAPVRLDHGCVPVERAPPDEFLDGSFGDNTLRSVSTNPEIGMNDAGHTVVVWDDNENEASALEGCEERQSIRASHFAPNEGWSAATKIGVPSSIYGTLHASTAVDSSGRVLAGSLEGKVSRFTESSGWTPLALGVDNRNASVAMADNGHAIAVWEVTDPLVVQPRTILAVRFTPEQGWGEAETFSSASEPADEDNRTPKSPTILDSASADVTVNNAGDAVVAWHQVSFGRDRETFNVWANHFTAGRGWATPTALSLSDTIEAAAPRVAMDSSGRGIAVWTESDREYDPTDLRRLMWSRLE